MNVAAFYHAYADGQWREPLAEHLAALEDAKFDGPFHVGIVGAPERVDEVRQELHWLRPPTTWLWESVGWEQVTLQAVHGYARHNDGAVLYAHTKGAARSDAFQDAWRRSMTYHLVSKWQNARDALASGHYDAVGSHWLTAEEYPHIEVDTSYPMFGGNFWMATCEYLRSLSPVGTGTRHEAESWIGLNGPRVLDLFPGWPGTVPFPRHKMRRLVASPLT